jgi:hypothetical protein
MACVMLVELLLPGNRLVPSVFSIPRFVPVSTRNYRQISFQSRRLLILLDRGGEMKLIITGDGAGLEVQLVIKWRPLAAFLKAGVVTAAILGVLQVAPAVMQILDTLAHLGQ